MDSIEKTLELFRQGRSMPEIAYGRRLAFSTIENHLAILLSKKRICIEELLQQEKIGSIKKAVPENPVQLSAIKDALPKEIAYCEIKWVLAASGNWGKPRGRQPPIVTAINTYRGNNCARKCFNHEELAEECEIKFGQAAESFGNSEISVGDFYRLVNRGELKICRLPEKQRRQAIIWKRLEEMQGRGRDLWDELGGE